MQLMFPLPKGPIQTAAAFSESSSPDTVTIGDTIEIVSLKIVASIICLQNE